MTGQTAGSFSFADWKEENVVAADDGAGIARASVVNVYSGTIEARGACEYTIVYHREGGTDGVFAGYERLSGSIAGRSGSVVLEHRGAFEGDTVHCTVTVVPGTGSGELAGVTGTGGFTARHGEESIPYAFEHSPG
ncbi:DUF3224 domain-containing protein [Streptomyces thermolineatus]|uniref:DUF3224 domain-containing protein n=1 Tax=Streptomyces thermolineatus TaxID=44033 RepID=A0ABN3L980_9ACTN